MGNCQTPQLGFDELQMSLVLGAKQYGVCFFGEIPRATLASRVNDLGSEYAAGEISPHNYIVGQRTLARPTRVELAAPELLTLRLCPHRQALIRL